MLFIGLSWMIHFGMNLKFRQLVIWGRKRFWTGKSTRTWRQEKMSIFDFQLVTNRSKWKHQCHKVDSLLSVRFIRKWADWQFHPVQNWNEIDLIGRMILESNLRIHRISSRIKHLILESGRTRSRRKRNNFSRCWCCVTFYGSASWYATHDCGNSLSLISFGSLAALLSNRIRFFVFVVVAAAPSVCGAIFIEKTFRSTGFRSISTIKSDAFHGKYSKFILNWIQCLFRWSGQL